ncbi:methionyl-tRNA formyltransferase [Patescibacteria group bacterium]|nr:methionyl-tRNA formyltransferase [Patescibacteria group bacterium]
MNVAFFGSSQNSLTVLKALRQAAFNIKLVVTAPPRPVGRKQILTKTPPHTFAEENGTPVFAPEKLDKQFLQKFQATSLDVCIVADYARLIPKEVLDHPKHGCLNLHPSLLPKYCGSSPAEAAILNGDKVTGLSIIQMDEKFDHGPIVAQFEEEIYNNDTSETLYQRLFSAGAKVLITILSAWVEGRIVPKDQNHPQATYAKRLTRDDGFIPWPLLRKATQGEAFNPEQLNPRLRQVWEDSEQKGEANKFSPGATARQTAWLAKQKKGYVRSRTLATKKISVGRAEFLERAIRAFYPWPGIWTIISSKSGKKRLKILSAHLEKWKMENGKWKMRLALDQVQLEGKTPQKFEENVLRR